MMDLLQDTRGTEDTPQWTSDTNSSETFRKHPEHLQQRPADVSCSHQDLTHWSPVLLRSETSGFVCTRMFYRLSLGI